MHHNWASLAPPRDRNDKFAPKQPSWQMKYHSAVFYLAENQPKSTKCSKPITNASIWGEVNVQKWCLSIDSGIKSPIFGPSKAGTFAQNAHFQGPKRVFPVPIHKNEHHFCKPTIPQIAGQDFSSKYLTWLDRFSANLKYDPLTYGHKRMSKFQILCIYTRKFHFYHRDFILCSF